MLIVFVKVLVTFCAAENTDEKNPPARFAEGDRDPGDRDSSAIGVKGGAMELDSLLCGRGPESDRMRLCEIMLPEGETIVLGSLSLFA